MDEVSLLFTCSVPSENTPKVLSEIADDNSASTDMTGLLLLYVRF